MGKKLRTYKCWVKGAKERTQALKNAPNAQTARIRFSASLGLKSYEVEVVWQRHIPSYSPGYSASR